MNKKIFVLLFLSIVAVAACPITLSIASHSATLPKRFDNKSCFALCGDPIDTPGWPCSVTPTNTTG